MNLTEKLHQIINSLPLLASEIFLMLSFILIVVVELFLYRKKTTESHSTESNTWLWGFSLAIVIFLFYITVNQSIMIDFTRINNGFFIIDASSIFFKILILLAAIILLIHIKTFKYQLQNEFYPLLIFQLLGLFLLCIASNFLIIYIAIEIISIASYVFATFAKNKKAAEAAIKYVLFGGVSSAIMLFGISYLYGITGTLDLLSPQFSRSLTQIEPIALSIILLMSLGGFLFKISAFPFHLWVPDVYEATPTPIISFLSIAPKAAGILILIRITSALPLSQQNIFILIAILSIIIGNFSALNQKNTKRMLAYSTIAQAGFLIAAIGSFTNLGIKSVYFYLFGYVFSNMMAFYLIDFFEEKNKANGYLLENYKGLGAKFPIWGIALVIGMISLVGLPPTVGFSGKFFIFTSLWEGYQINQNKIILTLLIIGLLNTAISLYFYLKLPFYAFFKSGTSIETIQPSKSAYLFIIILAFPLLFFFFKADLLLNWIELILKNFA